MIMKIILDCYGGDNSPFAQVEGAVNAINKSDELSVVLVGKADEIKKELDKYRFDEGRIEVLNANDVITCDDKPTTSIREKTNSSLSVAFDLLKHDEQTCAMVSSGSTGAILAGSILKIGRIKGISRPCLAPFLPTFEKNKSVMLVDCGANADCKPVNLLHFALMGSIYYRNVFGNKTPKVAILSIGTEEEKGSELSKEAYRLVKNLPGIDFCGNIEGRDILSGNYDVVVSDGFSGNVALKASEGAIMLAMKTIKREIKSSFISKIGALLMKKQFANVKKQMDYNQFRGAVVLGCAKPVIKAHGSSNATAIEIALMQALEVVKCGLIDGIKSEVELIGSEE